jgi:dTDP-4-amino-4,6-dideoxygalactose transaminase
MSLVRFFNPGKGYAQIKDEVLPNIDRILTNGDLILRKDGELFEKNLAEYLGVKHAIGLNSGTDALYLALIAAGVKPGDEVITCSHTFVATVQVINQLGAIPVLVDIDSVGLMDISEVEKAITNKTTAIIPVQLTGAVCNMKALGELAAAYNLIIIEDAAQALGAEYDFVKAGTFGAAGCFSFYPAKILGAYGDAGALVTNDDTIADEVRELRNHYKKDYSKWGINSRLDNIQAVVLNTKLSRLDETLQKRKMVAEKYLRELTGLPIGLPTNSLGRVWQDFVIRTPKRDELFEYLKRNGIETMKNDYPFPIPKLERSITYEKETLRLPCNELLELEEVKAVIQKIRDFYGA